MKGPLKWIVFAILVVLILGAGALALYFILQPPVVDEPPLIYEPPI